MYRIRCWYKQRAFKQHYDEQMEETFTRSCWFVFIGTYSWFILYLQTTTYTRSIVPEMALKHFTLISRAVIMQIILYNRARIAIEDCSNEKFTN